MKATILHKNKHTNIEIILDPDLAPVENIHITITLHYIYSRIR